MNIIDFFLDSKIKDDPYQEIPQDIVEMSKDFYLGKFQFENATRTSHRGY